MAMYHVPVMLEEALEGLSIRRGGVYVDLTFGGGGHTAGILARLEEGEVWGFDQDPDTRVHAEAVHDDRLRFIQGNFRFFAHFLRAYGVEKVDGILLDLGVSSHQLDTAGRGFAARLDGPLDMRMHQQGTLTAARVLNDCTPGELVRIFRQYGDIQRPKPLVAHVIEARRKCSLRSIEDFKRAIAPCVPSRNPCKYYAKVFQALRIVVNDEERALHDVLVQVPGMLAPEGRFVAITYHSGEDRPIKHFLRTGNVVGEVVQDVYGNLIRPMKPLQRKILRPATDDVSRNSRARSAGMRIGVLA